MGPAGFLGQSGGEIIEGFLSRHVAVHRLLQSIAVLIVQIVSPHGGFVHAEQGSRLADFRLQDRVVRGSLLVGGLVRHARQRGQALVQIEVVREVFLLIEPLDEGERQIFVGGVLGHGQTGAAQNLQKYEVAVGSHKGSLQLGVGTSQVYRLI